MTSETYRAMRLRFETSDISSDQALLEIEEAYAAETITSDQMNELERVIEMGEES